MDSLLYGQRTVLRPLIGDDISFLLHWERIDGHRYLPSPGGAVELPTTRVAGMQRRPMAVTVSDRLIGTVSLEQISWAGKRAELRVFIGPRLCRGLGLGTDAVKTMLGFAFDELGLHEVYLRVAKSNQPAICCYRKCGFRAVGRLTAGRHRRNGAEDLLLMVVTRDKLCR